MKTLYNFIVYIWSKSGFEMEIVDLSASELAKEIQNKTFSCVEVTKAYIQQVETINPKINAIVQFHPEKSLEEAKIRDQELSKGIIRGPIHGVPFTLKELFYTKGDLITMGCSVFKDNRAQEDGEIAKRLKRAGGVLLGKTNIPEFEMGAETDNFVYGRSSNPYHTGHAAGGSSGGSAAAVAACESAFDIGGDMGGSLRIPAHYCGVATIRSTPGRIPTTGTPQTSRKGFHMLLSTEGPIARSVSDLFLTLPLICAPDGIDPKILPLPFFFSEKKSFKGLRVAFFTNDGISEVTPEIKKAVEDAAEALKNLGAIVHEDRLKNIGDGYEIFAGLIGAGFTEVIQKMVDELKFKPTDIILKIMKILEPYACDVPTFLQRWIKWEDYRSQMLQFMKNYDVLLAPVTATPALPHNQSLWDPGMVKNISYAWEISASLLPSAVIRAGSSPEGLPIGIQVIANPCREDVSLFAAQAIEKQLGGWKKSNIL